MKFQDPIRHDDGASSISLSDGRVAHVVESHHASPAERWRMYTRLRAVKQEYYAEGHKMSRRQRWKLNRMFLKTVLSHDCKACWYEIK